MRHPAGLGGSRFVPSEEPGIGRRVQRKVKVSPVERPFVLKQPRITHINRTVR